MNTARLFNCCTDYAVPNWSEFCQLELAGCVTNEADDVTEGLQPASKAAFFTVYGRFHAPDSTCEAITDIDDPRDAIAVAAELALISGLPCIVHVSLTEDETSRFQQVEPAQVADLLRAASKAG